jgi:hypothetical protein
MNITLWVLQILLSLHTLMGAIWKFSNSERSVPSLRVIPHELWLAMSVLELLCSLGLILPAINKSWSFLVPIAAACIAAEMLLFVGLDVYSGDPRYSHIAYWLIVAAVCTLIAYGRLTLKPI